MSLNASAHYPLLSFIASISGAGSASASDVPSSPIAGSSPLSIVLGNFSSFITNGDPLSTVLGHLLSFVAGDNLLSIVSGHLSSLVIGSYLLSIVLGHLSSPVSLAGNWALFLTSILSHIHCSSLPSLLFFYFSLLSLPISLAYDPTLLTGKKLFDQAFITQKSIASIQ